MTNDAMLTGPGVRYVCMRAQCTTKRSSSHGQRRSRTAGRSRVASTSLDVASKLCQAAAVMHSDVPCAADGATWTRDDLPAPQAGTCRPVTPHNPTCLLGPHVRPAPGDGVRCRPTAVPIAGTVYRLSNVGPARMEIPQPPFDGSATRLT